MGTGDLSTASEVAELEIQLSVAKKRLDDENAGGTATLSHIQGEALECRDHALECEASALRVSPVIHSRRM